MKLNPLSAAVALATSLLIAGTASAQQEEIVVVGKSVGSMRLDASNGAGSRLGLTAFQTPASVDIITRDEITTKGDYDALAAITRTTGMSSSANPGNGGTSVSARGFNGHGSIMNTYDGTRLYITAGTVTFPADTWTLERVEVLRGAGSVINGFGAIGATINYIPKTPTPGDSEFTSELAAGSFSMNRIALGGGADLSDSIAYRLDGVHQSAESNVERNEETRNVLAGSLLFRPSDDLSMRLSVDYANIDEDSPYFGTPLINGEASDLQREHNYNFGDGFLEYEDLWTRLHTELQISPAITFRNDTYFLDAERQWQNLESYEYDDSTGMIVRDGYSYYGIIHDQEQIGTRSDVLIESDFGERSNRLSIGVEVNSIDLNYSDNWSEGIFYSEGPGEDPDLPPFTVPPDAFVPDSIVTAAIPMALDFTTDTQQIGFFIDDRLALSDTLSLVMGARFDDIEYSRFDYALGGDPSSAFDSDYSEVSWRLGVVYQPMSTVSFYGQYSRATDPITSPASMSGSFRNLEPTRGRQIEIGMKQRLMSGRAEYSLAWFDITKTDLLTTIPGTMTTEQVGKQTSDGLEFTFRVNAADSVSIDLNATWVNAEFEDYYSGGESLAGKTPNNIPETTANAWLNWSPLSQLSIGGGVRYVDTRFGNDQNTRVLPAYTVFDASASWSFSPTLQITLRARNLTDEEDYVLSDYGPAQWIFADPRSYEIGVRYSM